MHRDWRVEQKMLIRSYNISLDMGHDTSKSGFSVNILFAKFESRTFGLYLSEGPHPHPAMGPDVRSDFPAT